MGVIESYKMEDCNKSSKSTQTEVHKMHTADQKTMCTEILHQINELRLQELFCDSTLLVEGQTFPVHKTILVATSQFFSDLMCAQSDAVYQVNGISPADFLHILDFLYTGQIALDANNARFYKSIAQQLKIEALSRACEQFLGNVFEQEVCRKRRRSSIMRPTKHHTPQRTKTVLMKKASCSYKLTSTSSFSLSAHKHRQVMPSGGEINSSHESKSETATVMQETVPDNQKCTLEQNETLTIEDNANVPVQKSDSSMNVEHTGSSETDTDVPVYKNKDKVTGNQFLICEWCGAALSTTHALYRHVKQNHCEQMYKCHHCPRQFTTSDMFERHMDHCRLSRQEDGKYHCPKCEYGSKRKTLVVEHFRLEHTNRLKNVCEFCGNDFNGLDAFYDHQLKSHNVAPKSIKRKVHSCDLCGFKTVKLHAFKVHVQNHIPGKFKCDICSINCNSEKNLDKHKRNIHHNTLLYKCTLCNYTSKYKATLLSHAYRKHQVVSTDKQKIYYCHYCDYSHIDMADFRRHEKHCHSDEKQFSCGQCSKCFKHKTQLHVHERIHSGDRPFLCEQCEYSARSRPALLAHIRHSHSTEKNYVCNYCGFATKGPSNLLSHKKRCKQNCVQIEIPASVVTVVDGSVDVENSEITNVETDYVLSVPEIFQ